MAITSKGSSNSTPTKITTDQTNPGLVQYLKVAQDTVIAKKITLTFPCPGEQEWNGAIKGFVIKQLDNVTGAVFNYSYNVVSCRNEINFNDVTDITVGYSYSFHVKAVNVLYDGDFGPPTFLSVEAKVPQLKTVMDQLRADKFVKAPVPSTAQETSIALVVCAQCLADNSQGEIIHAGLVICVKGVSCPTTAGRKRRALPASDYSNYLSWSAAAKNNFISQYRTTPDDWRNTLQQGNPYAPYTVGSNTSCDRNAESVFCNGPLPEGKAILITVVVCTSAGCEVLEDKDDEYVLKVRAAEMVNIGAIVGGVLGGVALIVLIIILIIVYRRGSAKEKSVVEQNKYLDTQRSQELDYQRHNRPVPSREHVLSPEIGGSTNIYSEVNDYDYIELETLHSVRDSVPPNSSVMSNRGLNSRKPFAGESYPKENVARNNRGDFYSSKMSPEQHYANEKGIRNNREGLNSSNMSPEQHYVNDNVTRKSRGPNNVEYYNYVES